MSKSDDMAGCFGVVALAAVLFLACGGCALRFTGGLMPDYSEGTRVGTVFKFSHKGWMWKSWEGELMLNEFALRRKGEEQGSNVFEFSCLDAEVAKSVEEVLGKKVRLHYRQYLIGPMQQGTRYNVVKVEPVE